MSGHVATLEKKLANENFVQRAPADVVQQQRDKLTEIRQQLANVREALSKLS